MLEIHTTHKAKKDLEGIWIYSFKQWGEKRVDKYFDELDESIHKTLLQNPKIGTAYDYVRSGYRRFQVNEHSIFYKLTSTKILIVRVLHKSMRFENHLIH